MRTTEKTRKIRLVSTILAGAILAGASGCATKGPKRVYAAPVLPEPRRVAPADQAIADAPRNQPGRIMDPDAITYAQVPSRILYLPGQHGIFGRESARQEVAYNLVPVERIGAIQAQGTPEFGEIQTQEKVEMKVDITEMTVTNPDGSFSKGQARRLGVLGQSDAEKTRAENLLRRGEEIQWSAEVGWVGFTPEKKAKPYEPEGVKKKEEGPSEITAPEKANKPSIEPLEEPKKPSSEEVKKTQEEDLELELGPGKKETEIDAFSFE